MTIGEPETPFAADRTAIPTDWHDWLLHKQTEVVCASATLVFLVLGWGAAHALPPLPAISATSCFLAYLTGGYFGVRASWRSLRQRTVNVDLLVVLAAIGAAFVGVPFEGAWGLFLLSLSNVLQDWAINRAHRAIGPLGKSQPAHGEKTDIQRLLEKSEQPYIFAVLILTAALIFVPWLGLHQALHEVFYRAITVMVVASPCAVILGTTVANLAALGGAARRGILIKGGAQLERLTTVQVLAFNQTGTLTRGEPQVTDIIASGGHSAFLWQPTGESLDLLRVAAAVEAPSGHPLARAIAKAARERRLGQLECTEFQSVSGKSVAATVNHRRIAVGSIAYFKLLHCCGLAETEGWLAALQDAGKTCVLVGEITAGGDQARMLGVIALADGLRPGAAAVITRLRQLGVKRTVLLTGDHHRVAEVIARETGVDEVHAQLMPEDKVRVIRALLALGPVAMVGNGGLDAPALAAADLGLALGADGTDGARETAGVAMLNGELRSIPFAIEISRRAHRVVAQNFTFALGVTVGLVVAALTGHVTLPLGMLALVGSTALVCLNGLRLLRHSAAPAAT